MVNAFQVRSLCKAPDCAAFSTCLMVSTSSVALTLAEPDSVYSKLSSLSVRCLCEASDVHGRK